MERDSRTDIWNADRLWRGRKEKLMTGPVQILHGAVMIMPFRGIRPITAGYKTAEAYRGAGIANIHLGSIRMPLTA